MIDYNVIYDIPSILCGLLLIPYLMWGVHLLRRRISPRGEAATLFGVVLFLIVEMSLLRGWLSHHPVHLILAGLGLVVSSLALYGPILVSFTSHLFTEMVMPRGAPPSNEPPYGAAEGMEMRGDFEGAAREYTALARMFPKLPRPALAAADNFMKTDNPDRAVEWFEKGLALTSSDKEALPITNRLHEVFARILHKPDDARRVLEDYLKRFPDSDHVGRVQCRLDRFAAQPEPEEAALVTAMEEVRDAAAPAEDSDGPQMAMLPGDEEASAPVVSTVPNEGEATRDKADFEIADDEGPQMTFLPDDD
ncbi:MAG: tetratricopeptide repeat protein [bacterium]|nr:tetratricopeptide repeat protein [bacterium]